MKNKNYSFIYFVKIILFLVPMSILSEQASYTYPLEIFIKLFDYAFFAFMHYNNVIYTKVIYFFEGQASVYDYIFQIFNNWYIIYSVNYVK